MDSASPPVPDPDESVHADIGADIGADVGTFEPGSPGSRWALSRYLVGRAVIESVGRSLLLAALVVLLLAGLVESGLHSTLWAVLVALIAVSILAMRAILLAVLRRLSGTAHIGPVDARLNTLVDNTKSDVLAELRRVGLPGRIWTLPLLPFRFLGPQRRRSNVARLRAFEVERVVPDARVDELHLILRDTLGHDRYPSP